jgi:hypothetical protein
VQNPRDFPNEEEPGALLKYARNQFIGVMNDMGDHLFNSSQPPLPHLANGFADWQEFGFDSLAVEAAATRGNELMLVLSAFDLAAARRGLDKYRRTWEASLLKWFGGKVQIELQLAASIR